MIRHKFLAFVFLTLLIILTPRIAASQMPFQAGAEMTSDQTRGEVTAPLANLWDGVDSQNDLHVLVGGGYVLNDAGKMVETTFPSCPDFVDMNNDGFKDLVVADTHGFVWIYLNSGKKGNPKFTTGKFLHTFIGWASRIHVCDWDGDGDNDIVVGTFYGDVVILENTGGPQSWRFTRSMGIPRYVEPRFSVDDPRESLRQIMIGKQPLIKGNYLSPWVCDWNKDGKSDLLLGEGTYSANSVHLYLNGGSRMKPAFSEEREFFLAYGEGYEQLTPSVVDYNGDGLDDLIVGTRTGQIRLHKGTKKAADDKDFIAAMRGTLAPAILEYEGNLEIGGKEVFDKMSTVFPCDWNEDGLFDLLLGSTSGKIYIALNKGTKTEPKFPEAVPVKGTDVEKDLLAPAGWWNGIDRIWHVGWQAWWYYHPGGFCNTALLLTCEKEVALKPGAAPVRPVSGDYFIYFRYVHDYPGWTQNPLGISVNPKAAYVVGGRIITPSPSQTFNLRLGKRYTLSFSSIIEGKPVFWRFGASELVEPATDTTPPRYAHHSIDGTIAPSTSWAKRSFTFKSPNTVQTNLNYSLHFRTPEGDCQFLLDNFSLKELAN